MRKALQLAGLTVFAFAVGAGSLHAEDKGKDDKGHDDKGHDDGMVPAGSKCPSPIPDNKCEKKACNKHAKDVAGNRIIFKMKNARNVDGVIRCTIYSADAPAKSYPVKFEDRYDCTDGKWSGKDSTCVFEGLKPGEYAIASMHDEDCNCKFKTNENGIPMEGSAASNNAHKKSGWGPPKYEKAKFDYKGGELVLESDFNY